MYVYVCDQIQNVECKHHHRKVHIRLSLISLPFRVEEATCILLYNLRILLTKNLLLTIHPHPHQPTGPPLLPALPLLLSTAPKGPASAWIYLTSLPPIQDLWNLLQFPFLIMFRPQALSPKQQNQSLQHPCTVYQSWSHTLTSCPSNTM